jgi:hypothetical protein
LIDIIGLFVAHAQEQLDHGRLTKVA